MAERLKLSGRATVEKLDEAKERLKRQSEGHSAYHSDDLSKEHSEEHTDEHSTERSIDRAGGHSNVVADSLADTLADSLAVSQESIPKGTLKHTLGGTPANTLADGPGDNPFFWMTPSQAAVLKFLGTIPGGKTRIADISNGSGVPYGTVRKSLVALERNACITKPKKIRIGQWQGMHLELLEAGKKWFNHNNTLNTRSSDSLAGTLAGGQSGGHSGGRSLYSSSSYLNNTTTENIGAVLSEHPELGYWRQKGITVKQIEMWQTQLKLSFDDILQSLCHCKFDMVDNKREEKDKIEDVFNWFFRIIQRAGAYHKPKGYKSHHQLALDREKSRLEELQRQASELKKMREQSLCAQAQIDFEKMLKDPDGSLYKKCFDGIPAILKNSRKKGSLSFVNAMKKVYCEINDIDIF